MKVNWINPLKRKEPRKHLDFVILCRRVYICCRLRVSICRPYVLYSRASAGASPILTDVKEDWKHLDARKFCYDVSVRPRVRPYILWEVGVTYISKALLVAWSHFRNNQEPHQNAETVEFMNSYVKTQHLEICLPTTGAFFHFSYVLKLSYSCTAATK